MGLLGAMQGLLEMCTPLQRLGGFWEMLGGFWEMLCIPKGMPAGTTCLSGTSLLCFPSPVKHPTGYKPLSQSPCTDIYTGMER